MSDCERYQELISRMLDEDLSAEETERLHAHIASCPECRRVADAFSMLHTTMADDLQPPPEGFSEAVMEQIRHEPVSIAKKRGARIGRWFAIAACLAIIAFSAYRFDLLFSKKGASRETAPNAAAADQFVMESKAQIVAGGAAAVSPAKVPVSADLADVPADTVSGTVMSASEGQAVSEPESAPDVYLTDANSESAPNTLEYDGAFWSLKGYVKELPRSDAEMVPQASAAQNEESINESISFDEAKPVLIGNRVYLQIADELWAEYEK